MKCKAGRLSRFCREGGIAVTDRSQPPSIRTMSPPDIPAAVRLHERELTDDFMSRFGSRFLAELYRAFVRSPHAVALVSVDLRTGGVTGALLATLNTLANNSFVVRSHGPALAFHGLGRALSHPALARDVLRTRGRRYARGVARSVFAGRRAAKPQREGAERVGVVNYVMVDGGRRGGGIGASLVAAYEELAWSADLERLELVTYPGGRGAGRFYRRIGWRYAGERISASGERFALYTRYPVKRPGADRGPATPPEDPVRGSFAGQRHTGSEGVHTESRGDTP